MTETFSGRIVKALSGFYYVDSSQGVFTCKARGRLKRLEQSPLVGDMVSFSPIDENNGIVESVFDRKNYFDRPSIANVDQLVILASKANPETDPYLIDRLISNAVFHLCEVLVVLTKTDLERPDELYDIYQKAGIQVQYFSAKTGEGKDELFYHLQHKVSVLTGNSGVGKSSMLNYLDPKLCLKTDTVSDALGRGKHTTRHIELFQLDEDTYVADTPGFASFDSAEFSLEYKLSLPDTFTDFRPWLKTCRYENCVHAKEKDCGVKQAVQEGCISLSRYQSYLRLLEETSTLKEWMMRK